MPANALSSSSSTTAEEEVPLPARCSYCHRIPSHPKNAENSLSSGGTKLLRCSQCQSAWYCSRQCQKRDWKYGGHRQVCHPQQRQSTTPSSSDRCKQVGPVKKSVVLSNDREATAKAAAAELTRAVMSLSIEDAHADFGKATDEINRLLHEKEECEEKKEKEFDEQKDSRKAAAKRCKDDGEDEKGEEKENHSASAVKSFHSTNDSKSNKTYNGAADCNTTKKRAEIDSDANMDKNLVKQSVTPPIVLEQIHADWSCTMEELKNVSYYSVTIVPPRYKGQKKEGVILPNRNSLQIKFEHGKEDDDTNNNNNNIGSVSKNDGLSSSRGWTRVFIRHIASNKNKMKQKKENSQTLLASIKLSMCIHDENLFRVSVDDKDGYVSLRMPLVQNDDEDRLKDFDESFNCSNVRDLNRLSCRSCGFELLSPLVPSSLQGGGCTEDENGKGTALSDVSSMQHNDNSSQTLDGNGTLGKIRNVLPLPTGYWDEIVDYLTCYEGQPVVNFCSNSTSAVRSTALEDGCVIVLHREDLEDNVCVLAIDGYGEMNSSNNKENVINSDDLSAPKGDTSESEGKNLGGTDDLERMTKDGAAYRGERSWRDSVGGATVTCGSCCSTLGFASVADVDTFRLYKHRLGAGVDRSGTTKGHKGVATGHVGDSGAGVFKSNTCGSFISREMVRYAESQAVYTFVVAIDSDSGGRPSGGGMFGDFSGAHSINGKCLLLRLLSWDTTMAIHDSQKENQRSHCPMQFDKIVKIIYEETDDLMRNDGSKKDDLTSWIWGGVDLCCLPQSEEVQARISKIDSDSTVSQKTSKASVRIYLSREEWMDLRDELVSGSALFASSLAKATVLLKLGRDHASRSDKAGLSYLKLLD